MFFIRMPQTPQVWIEDHRLLRIQASYQPFNNKDDKLFFKFYLTAIKNIFNDTLLSSRITKAQREAEHFLCKDKNM